MQRVLDGIGSTLGQVQCAQLGIDFLEVRHGGHTARFQSFHGDHVFDARSHSMTSETLGVRDHNPVGGIAEDATQRVDLC